VPPMGWYARFEAVGGSMDTPGRSAHVRVEGALVRCAGPWTLEHVEGASERLRGIAWPAGSQVVLEGDGVEALDTAGAWLFHRTARELEARGRRVELRLRPEHAALVRMVRATGLAAGDATTPGASGRLERLGRLAAGAASGGLSAAAFVGECAAAAARSIAHPSRIRGRPVLHQLQRAGSAALPIVGLLTFLMGIVIAYQGAAQLRRYGASVFVADLVGLAMLRELSPLLTAIIVAGRSGSAFAAQIGTMKVTEEIDALRTVGIAPVDLLVLPKIVALSLAMPLLTVYGDILGVAGGMLMAHGELAVGYQDFLDRFVQAIDLSDYLVGVGKAPVFAAIIAVVGCHQGFQVSGDAESVGRRTTTSVVYSVFLVIVADALFSVTFSYLGI